MPTRHPVPDTLAIRHVLLQVLTVLFFSNSAKYEFSMATLLSYLKFIAPLTADIRMVIAVHPAINAEMVINVIQETVRL